LYLDGLGFILVSQTVFAGVYQVDISYSGQSLAGSPFNITVDPLDCKQFDANSVPNDLGTFCSCLPGYQTVVEGSYVTCIECQPGTVSTTISTLVDPSSNYTQLEVVCQPCGGNSISALAGSSGCTDCVNTGNVTLNYTYASLPLQIGTSILLDQDATATVADPAHSLCQNWWVGTRRAQST
jgi:hypothetical protein